MTQFEIYIFVLCLIVFLILTITFSLLIGLLLKLTIALIRTGAKDEEIWREYRMELENKKKKSTRVATAVSTVFSSVICLILSVIFIFSLILNITENRYSAGIPSLKVVKSDSMSEKHRNNTYLTQNNLNNQLQVFDLIVANPLPAENALKLYDIVLYEREGDLIIHRIVKIEEPNEKHPDKRYFTLQGDAEKYIDEYPVTYDMMRAVYSGTRIPFAGNFVLFMQSPAGWLCFLLVLFTVIITPVVERKLLQEKDARLRLKYIPKPPVTKKLSKKQAAQVEIFPLQLSRSRISLELQKGKPQIKLGMKEETEYLKVVTKKRREDSK